MGTQKPNRPLNNKDCLTSSSNLAFPSLKENFILYNDASQSAIGFVLAQVPIGLKQISCYAFKPLKKAKSRYTSLRPELLAIVIYTRHCKHYLLGRQFKTFTDHRMLQWLHDFKDPDPLAAPWLNKLAAIDYAIAHRSGKSIGHAGCMSLFLAKPTAFNVTTVLEVDASIDWQRQPSLQHPPFSTTQTPPTRQSKSIPYHGTSKKINQSDDEQSDIRNDNATGENKNNQTVDQQSKFQIGNEAAKKQTRGD